MGIYQGLLNLDTAKSLSYKLGAFAGNLVSGFVLATLLLTPYLIYRAIKRHKMFSKNILIMILVIGIILNFFAIYGLIENKVKNKNIEKSGTRSQKENYVFTTEGCEYSVSFAEKPHLYSYQARPFGNIFIDGYGAKIISMENVSLVSAETVNLPESIFKVFNETYANALMKNYAKQNGIARYQVFYSNDNQQQVSSIIFDKEIDGIMIRYSAELHLGKRSAIILYTGSPVHGYPSDYIVDFIGSLKRAN